MPRKTSTPTSRRSGFGNAVLASLRGWEAGEPVTVRHVQAIPAPLPLVAAEVKKLRTDTLGVSQAVFAQLMGISPKLVEAWEAGRNTPSGPARRLIELIRSDPARFKHKYLSGAA